MTLQVPKPEDEKEALAILTLAVRQLAGLPTGPTYHGGGSAYAEWRTAEINRCAF